MRGVRGRQRVFGGFVVGRRPGPLGSATQSGDRVDDQLDGDRLEVVAHAALVEQARDQVDGRGWLPAGG